MLSAKTTVNEGSDTNVQATNDDAQVSKASCARHGYYNDPFISFFVRKATRRSPLIHRGYYARNSAIRQLLHTFLSLAGSSAQVLSVGAGFDTSWFLLKQELLHPARYVEVDFHEVTRRKVKIVQAHEELHSLLPPGGTTRLDPGAGSIVSPEYSVLPVDLRDTAGLQRALDATGFDMRAPTLVLAECVLVYMDPAESRALLTWLAGRLPTAACAIYEQVNPDDAFGRQMVTNLEMRGCPLKGLPSTPTLEAHRQRLLGCGWGSASATDMDTVYRLHLDPDDKRRIERLEIFDEYEEWHMMMDHYCIALGINDEAGVLSSFGFKKQPVATMPRIGSLGEAWV